MRRFFARSLILLILPLFISCGKDLAPSPIYQTQSSSIQNEIKKRKNKNSENKNSENKNSENKNSENKNSENKNESNENK